MEAISGFLLWIGDLIGVKWIKKENNGLKKLVKTAVFLMLGILALMIYFMIWY